MTLTQSDKSNVSAPTTAGAAKKKAAKKKAPKKKAAKKAKK